MIVLNYRKYIVVRTYFHIFIIKDDKIRYPFSMFFIQVTGEAVTCLVYRHSSNLIRPLISTN